MLRPRDLVDDRVGDVRPEPLHAGAVMRLRRGPTHAEDGRHTERLDVEGRALATHAVQVGDEGRTVGAALRPALLLEAGPGRRAHHPAEEALRLVAGIVRHPWPGLHLAGAGSTEPQPRHGWLVRPDGVEGPRLGQCRADHDDASEAVADGDHRPTLLRACLLGQEQQILHVTPQVNDPTAPGALVPPPVVGDRGELGEPPHHHPEAVPPIEGPVDEHDGRGARCR